MGKFRKMLAGVLSAAMVLSTMTVTAFAEDNTSAPKKTAATIDTSLTGSITIHKYEYNGTTKILGTGETTDKLPTDADVKPLQGVGFTIYKVADVDDLAEYYKANPKSLPSVNDYLKDEKIDPTKVEKKVTEVKTDKNGIAEFNNLELGFYVVVETTTPDKVTDPVDPFIVSVPMTTKDGDNWLYAVHVYPKNKTTYGEVTLEKKGNNTELLSGVEFVLQKKNGESWTPVNNNDKTGQAYNLTTNKSGLITVEGLSQGTYRFIETNRGGNDGYIMDGATTYAFTVDKSGKTYNADGTKLLTNNKIIVNNEKPDMTKQVQKREDANPWGQDADYSVGDMVPYKITIDVPSNITKLKEFTLTDTPTNLDDKVDTVKLQCENSDVNTNAYSVAKDGDHGFKITFTTADMTPYAGKKIVVTYNAELLSTADTTTAGNPNTAKLEYSNKILPDTDDDGNPNKPGTPGKDAIKDTATVYTFKLQINKKANSVDGDNLTGVKFDLYKEVPAGTKGAASAEDVKNAGLNTNKTWMKIAADLTTENGTVEKSGLANGTYYLVETKTVESYNLLKAPVEVTLNIVYKTTTKKEYVIDENGVKTLVKNEIEKTKTTFTENEATSTGTHTETIINKQGFELPITGGMGTVLFSIAGFALMAGAAFVLLKGRRKDA